MITLYIGADHRGYHLAEMLEHMLEREGYTVFNLSSPAYTPTDDYVDFARAVSEEVRKKEGNLGIVLCGSGGGVTIAANKVNGIRAVLGYNPKQVQAMKADDDANVLALASDFLDAVEAKELVNIFLKTKFSGVERHVRRIQKIKELE